MEEFVKIIDLNNEYEANLMKEILDDKKIPHGIISSAGTVFGGIERLESGWGYLEAPAKFRDRILSIYQEITKK